MDPNNATSERNKLLKRFESFFEFPMVVLGFVWLVLLIIELVYQTTPLLETFGVVIWVIFILDFVIKFALGQYSEPIVVSIMLVHHNAVP